MASPLAPPPVGSDPGSFAWVDWYTRLTNYLNNGNSIPWSVVNKAGSSLQDLATRNHSDLQLVQGSVDQYHVSAAQYAALSTSYVNTFNTRTGAVTLTSGDVTTALTYTPVQSVAGRGGVVVLSKSDVGLGNVDNTSDVNKPVSTAQATSIATKALLAGSVTQAFSAATLAVGTTLSSWDTSTINPIQNGFSATFGGHAASDNAYMIANSYYNGGWKYIHTNSAGQYFIAGNVHTWRGTASGTAGGAVTWTDVMTLNVSGDLTPIGKFGCNGKAAQGSVVSDGTLATVIVALKANGIMS